MTIAELELPTTNAATPSAGTTMKALVYHGPGERAWEDKPRPTVQDAGDAIVRITTSTICGTDLHILKGDLPAVTDLLARVGNQRARELAYADARDLLERAAASGYIVRVVTISLVLVVLTQKVGVPVVGLNLETVLSCSLVIHKLVPSNAIPDGLLPVA